MSCALEARREARRQKILNNAQNRIRMIVDGEKSMPAGVYLSIQKIICSH